MGAFVVVSGGGWRLLGMPSSGPRFYGAPEDGFTGLAFDKACHPSAS